MEKRQLIIELNNIIDKQDLSVDLYFVFKNGDTYTQYLANPNNALRAEIIDGYTESLQTFTDSDNPYEINDIYDDNEYEDYHLFYDNIGNNPIAQSIFIFNRANTNQYTNDVGSLSRIHGFLIEISNGENSLIVYKRNQPTNAINPAKVINFLTGADNQLKLISQNAIYLTKSVDLFKIGNTILINSRNVYEQQFGFVAQLKAKAETSFIDLTAIAAFEIDEIVGNYVSNLPKGILKKLSSISSTNPILVSENWAEIKKQARRYAKHEFESTEDGIIKIQSKKELIILISILNRDYNFNSASKERFLTKNKKLIN